MTQGPQDSGDRNDRPVDGNSQPARRGHTRRTVLSWLGTAGALGISGCSSLNPAASLEPSEPRDPSEPSDPSQTATVTTPGRGGDVSHFTSPVSRSLVGEFGRINTVTAGRTTYYLGGPQAVRRLTLDGRVVWETTLNLRDSDFVAEVTVGEQLALCTVENYGGDEDHARLIALETATGRKQWEFQTLTTSGRNRLGVVEQVAPGLIVAGSDGGDQDGDGGRPERLYGIDPRDGDTYWELTDFGGNATFSGIFAFRYEPYLLYNYLYKIDVDSVSGRVVASPGGGSFNGGVRDRERLYLTSNTVQAFDMVTGSVRWETDISAPPMGAVQTGDHYLFVGTEEATVVGLRKAGGQPEWRVEFPEAITALEYAAGLVWILGETGALQAVREGDGSLLHESELSTAVDDAGGFRSLSAFRDTILVDDAWARLFRVAAE